MPRLPSFPRLRSQTQQASVRTEGPVPRHTSLPTVALADAASICSPRAPCLGLIILLTVARKNAASICSPRAPCLGYLASVRLREQTQQASVRRGPRASATLASKTVARTYAASICSPRAPCLGYLASHGCANRRSKHLFAEGPVPRLPSFSRLREQTQQAPVRRGPRASAT